MKTCGNGISKIVGKGSLFQKTQKFLTKLQITTIQDGGARHLAKSENNHISTAVEAISTKFGPMTQFDLLDRSDGKKNLKCQKSKVATAAVLKNKKSPYVGRD